MSLGNSDSYFQSHDGDGNDGNERDRYLLSSIGQTYSMRIAFRVSFELTEIGYSFNRGQLRVECIANKTKRLKYGEAADFFVS